MPAEARSRRGAVAHAELALPGVGADTDPPGLDAAPGKAAGTEARATPRPDGPTVSHVEAERQRREKLNRRFYDLRAAVPTPHRVPHGQGFPPRRRRWERRGEGGGRGVEEAKAHGERSVGALGAMETGDGREADEEGRGLGEGKWKMRRRWGED